MKHPVAYLRKSRVTTDRHVSWEVQEAAVKALALANGDPEPTIYFDWNKSGRKGRDQRPGYDEMLALIEAGEVSTLYSYSLSRLSRSLVDFAALVELCQTAGVQLKLAKEQHLDFSTASGRLMVNILASFAQMEAEIAKERSVDTVAVRRARGDHIGGEFFQDTDVVVKAWRESQSLLGTAKLLTEQRIPTRNGNRVWQPTSVRTILERIIPDELPSVRERGVKKAAPFLFYRLVKCHCGRLMTGQRYISGPSAGYVAYRCMSAAADPMHGRMSVTQRKILEWAMDEAALLCPPQEPILMADVDAKRSALLGRKDRLKRAYVDGLYGEEDYRAELNEIELGLANLDATGRVVKLEPIDWSREPAAVNLALRALWSHIQLDDEMKPVGAVWNLPEWRARTEAA